MANILIVDDSPTEVHVFRTMLEKNGHSVVVAQTGEEGIEKAKEVKPDLILMDVVMPGINGFQATRQLALNDATKTIPVIIVTTKDQETDKVWGIRQGAKDYIVKPVKEKDLIDRVKAALGLQSTKLMQDIFQSLQNTDRKCRARASELAILNRKKGDWVGIGFRIGETRLLSKMGEVTEILEMPDFTRVPGAKPWVVGIANVRGSLLPLMDIQGFVTGENLKSRKDGRVLVANLRGTNTGLVVNEVLGLRHFSLDDQAYELPDIENVFKPFIKQAFHKEQQYWPVFSLQALIEDERFLQAAL